MTIPKKTLRSKIDIISDILTVTLVASGKSKIMYGASISYQSLMKYLSNLLDWKLLEEVKKGNRTIYTTTNQGREYLHSYHEIKKLLSEAETKSEMALDYRPINHMDLRSELNYLKTRVERLEKIVPKLEFCPTCGKEIRPDFRLCPYCGEKLGSKEIRVRQT